MTSSTRWRWLPYLLCIAIGVLVMWPMSVYPSLLHRTPNTPLHMLVLEHLAGFVRGDVGDLSYVIAADFPDGRPVRIIGWPFQLLALPLVSVLGTAGALNTALLLSLMASGLLMVRLLERMSLGVMARAVGAGAWMMNPFLVSFLSNGQYENHVGWAFPLVLLGLMSGGARGGLAIALAIIGAAFSSPYQAIPVALVVLAALPFQRRHREAVLAALFFGLLACYLYFSGPQPAPGGECGPTSGTMPAVLIELLGQLDGVHLPPGQSRGAALVQALTQPVEWTGDLALHRMSVAPTVGFLGWVPLIGGLLGLALYRSHGWARPLALGGLVCWLLALGPDLALQREQVLDLPMPADVLGWMPGISQMGTTVRFLTGTAFTLVIGLALGMDWLAKRLSTGGQGGGLVVVLGLSCLSLIGAEWLYGTPSPVPMQAQAYRAPQGFDALPAEGAVLAIPVVGGMPPEAHLWMGVVHGQPVVGYCAEDLDALTERLSLVEYAQGGTLPDPSTVQAELAELADRGISYVAFITVERGADRFDADVRRIQHLLGPADAVGDSVLGYRTAR
jgi:hypothetical protein